jgi:hypothetical protein
MASPIGSLCFGVFAGQVATSFGTGKLEDDYGISGPSDLNKNLRGAQLIRRHRRAITRVAAEADSPIITPGLLAAIVRTQGGPNYPLLGWPEEVQGLFGACRGKCSLGITQMDVGNALRLEELGLMPCRGGELGTSYSLATDPELNLY